MRSITNVLVLLAIAAFLLSTKAIAQIKRYPKYSFGVGATTGIGTLHEELPTTGLLGLKVDYQANPLPWFSLRLDVGYSWVLKSVKTEQFTGSYHNGNEVIYYDNTLETGVNSSQFCLSLAPVFYYREGKVNLFAGVGGGIGTGRLSINRVLYINSSDIGQDTQGANLQDKIYVFGYFPFIGFSYGLGKKNRPHAEIELKLAQETWLLGNTKNNPFDSDFISKALTLQFTYRFLLEK
jgi:hypothetical protein